MKNIDVNIFSRFCKEIFDRKFIEYIIFVSKEFFKILNSSWFFG